MPIRMTEFRVKTNPFLPTDKIVLVDMANNPIQIITITDFRQKFFHLLNLGSVSE